ncbi:protein PROTON GRADIENT REGULATION 5, chloroplastic [Zea mays]|uniref:Protein PROTON GRADIENT REGULATION 5 chloroplastic n=3 Tax=Zea mays TaxID=4577 RepID=A0A1D6PYI3_MAIZE|nr:protein PROTON GRADIENT REGULATION 5, chloroplastic [Zea mays]AQK51513.1 Protein PROTON GRADIENT REGULATION 5 chloroplastic [Zea mays]|eukprot:XP_020407418.1 protein PROTON GRADIENT REGULATION 5, chloroplastic [Zea mays]
MRCSHGASVVWLPPHHKAPHPFHLFHPMVRSRTTTNHPTNSPSFSCALLFSLLYVLGSLLFERGKLSQPLARARARAKGMAAAVSFSRVRALPTWSSSVSGDDHHAYSVLATSSVSARPRSGARPLRSPAQMMGNVNDGKGLFAPLVVVARNIIGRKRFNQLRGKAIALHSQVINEFCKTIGADSKQRQGLIRLAKKNGEKLGFLA